MAQPPPHTLPTRFSAIQREPEHTSTQHNTTQHNTTQHNTTQHNTTQHNTTQHNTTQHNTTQHHTTQHNTAQHNTTLVCTSQTPPLAIAVSPLWDFVPGIVYTVTSMCPPFLVCTRKHRKSTTLVNHCRCLLRGGDSSLGRRGMAGNDMEGRGANGRHFNEATEPPRSAQHAFTKIPHLGAKKPPPRVPPLS